MPPHNLRTRIIPAYAGQISGVVCHSPGEQDHPRIRGTNLCCGLQSVKDQGSSPHTRDKCSKASGFLPGLRIIPAYAGQMGIRSRNSLRKRDHPRIRGTNLCCGLQSVKDQGSSPHTRDKCSKASGFLPGLRIIPAYAGQMGIRSRNSLRKRDHPRIRGTNDA